MEYKLAEQGLFTFEEISEMYDIPLKTIGNNYAKGKIEGVRLGRHVYVSKVSVDKWVKNYRPRPSNYVDAGLPEPLEGWYTMDEALTLIADILNKTRKN